LLAEHGALEAALSAPDEQLRAEGLGPEAIRALRAPDEERLAADLAWLEEDAHHLLTLESEEYPPLLRRIPDPPAALWVVGDPGALWQPQVALVGSRNPTAGGIDHARDFAAELARMGFTITSGLAAGVDVAAHRAALAVAGGRTVAVMGTGPDLVYPARHVNDAARICERGALVTEYAPGTEARKGHFPQRNRIISGLSLGVLVIEAGVNSGSLITARMAGEQGREVFALPGSLHNPLVRGCHRLIKQGARLVESTADIVAELGPLAVELAGDLRERLAAEAEPPPLEEPGGSAPQLPEDPDYARLWNALGYDPEPIDRVIERSGLEARAVASMLLLLELRDLVEHHPGGRVNRRA
ncbi:MAG: DNA-processing protein DprA, partial [Gammaproteobacteria bacterium]